MSAIAVDILLALILLAAAEKMNLISSRPELDLFELGSLVGSVAERVFC